MSNTTQGIIVLLCIFAIALFGSHKNTNTREQRAKEEQIIKQKQIESQIQDTQTKVDELKNQIKIEQDKKTQSEYYGQVTIRSVARSNDPKYEYIYLRASPDIKGAISTAGWRLQSKASGNGVNLPKGTYLYFANSPNSEEDIRLSANDYVYISTGRSPLGVGFRVNKCSGYNSQFQDFNPYLYTSCPAPRNEDLSSIPKVTINDACFDYIDNFPSCRIQTETLPLNWSYECKKFITEKISYSSCVNTHKNDTDFYTHEWRAYLNRSTSLWKTSREDIVLYDANGKVVSEYTY